MDTVGGVNREHGHPRSRVHRTVCLKSQADTTDPTHLEPARTLVSLLACSVPASVHPKSWQRFLATLEDGASENVALPCSATCAASPEWSKVANDPDREQRQPGRPGQGGPPRTTRSRSCPRRMRPRHRTLQRSTRPRSLRATTRGGGRRRCRSPLLISRASPVILASVDLDLRMLAARPFTVRTGTTEGSDPASCGCSLPASGGCSLNVEQARTSPAPAAPRVARQLHCVAWLPAGQWRPLRQATAGSCPRRGTGPGMPARRLTWRPPIRRCSPPAGCLRRPRSGARPTGGRFRQRWP